ncbi:hypothetical protein JCM10449v2_000431 [Rhodotorula kratochvilovae]
MSLKQELQVWGSALDAFDAGDYRTALARFDEINECSKTFFNMALIHATSGEHEQAVAHFDQAIALDNYLAVAYFQSGVSQFLLGRYEAARRDFSDALALFRDNHTIDYEQLGLKFKLHSCEGRLDEGMVDLQAAKEDKQSSEHDVIDEACADQAVGYTVFSIPVGVLFRPSDTKLQNLETRDYLGKAKVIAATNSNDLFVGFSGVKKLAATAGVTPPEGFVQVTKLCGRPRRSNTGDGRLESPLAGESNAPSSPKGRGPGLRKLGRSQTTKVSQTATSSFTGTATVSRSLTTTTSSTRSRPTPLPTPPSSTDGAQDEQQIYPPPPKGLLHARSNSSGLNSAHRQRYPECSAGPARMADGFYVPSRPARPAAAAGPNPARLAPPAPLSTRRGHHPAPLAPLTVAPGGGARPAVAGQPPERSSPSALPATPRDPAPAPAPAPALAAVRASPTALPYAAERAEDSESGSGGEPPFALARYASVARSATGWLVEARTGAAHEGREGMEGREKARRAGAIEMLASEMREALRLAAAPEGEGAQEVENGDGGKKKKEEPVALSSAAKIRVKLQYQGETRALNMTPETTLGEFVERVRRKFGSESNLPIKYRDSDGVLVSILDADDWECAVDNALDHAAGGKCGGKLEVVVGERE